MPPNETTQLTENGDGLFCNSNHEHNLLNSLRMLYSSKQLVDVTLKVNNETFECHRCVLAATSSYFRAMFTIDLNERRSGLIDLYDLDSKSVSLLVDYAYTGQVNITSDNVQNLLAAASMLSVIPVMIACARFMETQLDDGNCIGIHYFASLHGCEDLKIRAQEHIEKNFIKVSQGEEFLSLDEAKLGEILASNELNVDREELVYEALLRWLNGNYVKHSSSFPSLLHHIRFGLMQTRYVQEHVWTHKLISENSECQEILTHIRDLDMNHEDYTGPYNFNFILRSGMIKPEWCILLIGGVDQSRPSINCYNPLTRESYFMLDLRDDNAHYDIEDPASIVTDDNQIYLAGGNCVFRDNGGESPSDEDSWVEYGEEVVRKDVFLYDNDHDQWTARAPMLFPKSNFALTYIDGKIYCFGGLTLNQHPTEIVEKYDILLDRWTYVGMMPVTLVDLCVVSHAGMAYVLGGRTGVGAHNNVLRFDVRKCEWKSLAGMPTPRFKFGAFFYQDEIWIAGGQVYSHTSRTINREALSSVEIYNLVSNQWRQGPDLPEQMYNVGLSVINGRLYACGTTEYHRSAYRVYRYNVVCRLDHSKNIWHQIEQDLCDIRDFSCVTAKMHTRKLSQVFRPDVDT